MEILEWINLLLVQVFFVKFCQGLLHSLKNISEFTQSIENQQLKQQITFGFIPRNLQTILPDLNPLIGILRPQQIPRQTQWMLFTTIAFFYFFLITAYNPEQFNPNEFILFCVLASFFTFVFSLPVLNVIKKYFENGQAYHKFDNIFEDEETLAQNLLKIKGQNKIELVIFIFFILFTTFYGIISYRITVFEGTQNFLLQYFLFLIFMDLIVYRFILLCTLQVTYDQLNKLRQYITDKLNLRIVHQDDMQLESERELNNIDNQHKDDIEQQNIQKYEQKNDEQDYQEIEQLDQISEKFDSKEEIISQEIKLFQKKPKKQTKKVSQNFVVKEQKLYETKKVSQNFVVKEQKLNETKKVSQNFVVKEQKLYDSLIDDRIQNKQVKKSSVKKIMDFQQQYIHNILSSSNFSPQDKQKKLFSSLAINKDKTTSVQKVPNEILDQSLRDSHKVSHQNSMEQMELDESLELIDLIKDQNNNNNIIINDQSLTYLQHGNNNMTSNQNLIYRSDDQNIMSNQKFIYQSGDVKNLSQEQIQDTNNISQDELDHQKFLKIQEQIRNNLVKIDENSLLQSSNENSRATLINNSVVQQRNDILNSIQAKNNDLLSTVKKNQESAVKNISNDEKVVIKNFGGDRELLGLIDKSQIALNDSNQSIQNLPGLNKSKSGTPAKAQTQTPPKFSQQKSPNDQQLNNYLDEQLDFKIHDDHKKAQELNIQQQKINNPYANKTLQIDDVDSLKQENLTDDDSQDVPLQNTIEESQVNRVKNINMNSKIDDQIIEEDPDLATSQDIQDKKYHQSQLKKTIRSNNFQQSQFQEFTNSFTDFKQNTIKNEKGNYQPGQAKKPQARSISNNTGRPASNQNPHRILSKSPINQGNNKNQFEFKTSQEIQEQGKQNYKKNQIELDPNSPYLDQFNYKKETKDKIIIIDPKSKLESQNRIEGKIDQFMSVYKTVSRTKKNVEKLKK